MGSNFFQTHPLPQFVTSNLLTNRSIITLTTQFIYQFYQEIITHIAMPTEGGNFW